MTHTVNGGRKVLQKSRREKTSVTYIWVIRFARDNIVLAHAIPMVSATAREVNIGSISPLANSVAGRAETRVISPERSLARELSARRSPG